MAFSFATFIDRIVTLQEAAISGSKAYPVQFITVGDEIYWTNELLNVTPVKLAEGRWRYPITVIMRLHRGKSQQGYQADLERTCHSDVFTVLQYFNARNSLTLLTDNKENPLQYTVPESAGITSRGVGMLPNADGVQYMGSTYELRFNVNIDTL